MRYGIGALLKGIDIEQRRQLASRDELLKNRKELLADMINAGKRAQLQVEAILEGELKRLREGYGGYGKYGVHQGYFQHLDQTNDLSQGKGSKLPYYRDGTQEVETQVMELETPIDPHRMVHEELRVLLDYAQRHGQTEVTTSWLTRSGFKPVAINRILLAAEGAGD